MTYKDGLFAPFTAISEINAISINEIQYGESGANSTVWIATEGKGLFSYQNEIVEKYNVEKYNLDDNLNIFFDEKFDIITMFDVIEHLNSFISFEKILNKNLVKGGYLVLTTPNSNSIERLFNSSQYSGEFDPTHRILFTPYTMDFFLRRRGFVKIFNYTPYVFSFNRNIFNQNIMYGGQIFVLYKKK